MSWAEIKKAVNSDLNKPLNALIEEKNKELISLTGRTAIFTSNGTFTVPDGVDVIKISAIASGGDGSAGGDKGVGGAGGKSGAYVIGLYATVTQGQELTITVGEGNTSISNLLSLAKGGGSRYYGENTFAQGGDGGAAAAAPDAQASAGSGGNSYPSGSPGGAGGQGGIVTDSQYYAGGGGGGGGGGVPAFFASLKPSFAPGNGGAGAVRKGNTTTVAYKGTDGKVYGSGGGGGGGAIRILSNNANSTTPGEGGKGAPGVVVIEW